MTRWRNDDPPEEDDFEWMYAYVQEKLGWTDEQMEQFNTELGAEGEWKAVQAIWSISNKEQIEADEEAEEEYYRQMAEEMEKEAEE